MKKGLILLFFSFFLISAYSQNNPGETPYFTFGEGFGILSPDSNYKLNIRFRIQNRFDLETKSGNDFNIENINARVRRARLRFDGYVYSPKITYVLQLSMSRADMDWDVSRVPNIVRDAMIFYKVNKRFTLALGQTKLPGNRQRVVSSGDLQLVDRSILNSTFTIDRDFGIQAYYYNKLGSKFNYILRGAVTSGEGRNSEANDNGVAYTCRIEILPFGLFEKKGDYFESDLAREKTPKLSLASAYSYNSKAKRTSGQLGLPLYESRDLKSLFLDFIFKFRGFSMQGEYSFRHTQNPITIGNLPSDIRYVYTGDGYNFQSGYLFKNNYEIAVRYSKLVPNSQIKTFVLNQEQYTLGFNKYIRGHRLKVQTDFTYQTKGINFKNIGNLDEWIFRFQVELGI